MIVYEVRKQLRYQMHQPHDERYEFEQFQGSVIENWEGREGTLVKDKFLEGNFLDGARGAIICDEVAKHYLCPVLNSDVQFLPIKIDSKSYYIINPIVVIDALDKEKTKWRDYDEGNQRTYEKAVFDVSKLRVAPVLFKMPQHNRLEIFTVEDKERVSFRHLVRALNLHGLEFIPVWDSEVGPPELIQDEKLGSEALPNESEGLTKMWQEQGLWYLAQARKYEEKRYRPDAHDLEEPGDDPRREIAERVLISLRFSTSGLGFEGDIHKRYPPSHSAFAELARRQGTVVDSPMIVNKQLLAVRQYVHGEHRGFEIKGANCRESGELKAFGRSSNKKFFGLATEQGVEIRGKWKGRALKKFEYPSGYEGIAPEFMVRVPTRMPKIQRLIPFDSGDGILLATDHGVFITAGGREWRRLAPDAEMMMEVLEDAEEGDLIEFLDSRFDGALAPGDRWIIATVTENGHVIYDRDLQRVAHLPNRMWRMTGASFSQDGQWLVASARGALDGMTFAVPMELIGVEEEITEETEGVQTISKTAAMMCAVWRSSGNIILGDAEGFVREFAIDGQQLWYFFVGGEVTGVDLAPEEEKLIVTSDAGYASEVDLDTGQIDPFAVTDSTHREKRRWLFWRDENHVPLVW